MKVEHARLIDRLAIALYVAFVGLIPVYALQHPFHNWDMLVYIGSALRYEKDNPARVHEQAYALARAAVPPQAYEELTSGDPYRNDVATDAQHFQQQLTFARLRPAYVFLIYLLGKLGVFMPAATVLISSVSCAGLAVLLVFWLSRYVPARYGVPIAFLFIAAADVVDTARLSTADGLSALVVVAAFLLLIHGRRPTAASVLLLAAIAVRSDNIVLAGMFIAALTVTRIGGLPLPPGHGLLLLGAAGAVHIAVSLAADNYPWWTIFVHSFIGPLVAPAGFQESFDAVLYRRVMLERLAELRSPGAIFFLLLGIATLAVDRLRQHREQVQPSGMRTELINAVHGPPSARPIGTPTAVTLLILVTAAVRFVLFPVVRDRFNLPFYAVITVMLVMAAASTRRAT